MSFAFECGPTRSVNLTPLGCLIIAHREEDLRRGNGNLQGSSISAVGLKEGLDTKRPIDGQTLSDQGRELWSWLDSGWRSRPLTEGFDNAAADETKLLVTVMPILSVVATSDDRFVHHRRARMRASLHNWKRSMKSSGQCRPSAKTAARDLFLHRVEVNP